MSSNITLLLFAKTMVNAAFVLHLAEEGSVGYPLRSDANATADPQNADLKRFLRTTIAVA